MKDKEKLAVKKSSLKTLIEFMRSGLSLDQAIEKAGCNGYINNQLHITTKHTDKMEGMQSISTASLINENCIRNAKNKKCVCSHCFATGMQQMYPDLTSLLVSNAKKLSGEIIPLNDLPVINACMFRFESFGDLINETQLINYINIVNKNKHVRFALWTKQYKIVYDYFKEHKCPSNLNLIISSYNLNDVQDISFLEKTKSFKKGQLKSFTVYSYEFAKTHNIKINCGARKCLTCGKCYLKNNITDVKELLKEDRQKAIKDGFKVGA